MPQVLISVPLTSGHCTLAYALTDNLTLSYLRPMRKWIVIISILACACKNTSDPDNGMAAAGITIIPAPGDSSLRQGQPLLHTDPGGQTFLSWVEQLDSTTHRLQYAQLTDTGWTAARTIASGSRWFVNWADFPQFASDGKGHFIATYLQKSGTGTYAYDVMVTMSSGGTAWSQPMVLHDDGKEAEHGFVSIAPATDGFLVSWLDGRRTNPMPSGDHDHDSHDGGQMTLRVALLDTAGKKRWEQEVDDRTCDCCQTSVAIGPEGPMVAYRDRSAGEIRDIYIARISGTGWQAPLAIHPDVWEINGCPVNGPQMAAAGNTVAVAWYTEARNQPAVYAAFSTDGGKHFGDPISFKDSIPLGRVDLRLSDDQTAQVTWMEGEKILSRSVSVDGKLGPLHTIARNSSARASGFPQITESGKRLVFAWTDFLSRKIITATMGLEIDQPVGH